MNRIRLLETIWQDTGYALRTMRKNPVFAATAVLVLTLGIGGNAAMFTIIRAVLLKPLEYRDPDRLVRVSVDNPGQNYQDAGFTQTQYEELKAARCFTELAAFFISTESMNLSGASEPEALTAARVSANFLNVLGVQPVLGRGFLSAEDRRGGQPVGLISTQLWKRRFGGDLQVAGKTMTLNSTSYTIIGVLPAGFEFPFPEVSVWVTRPSEFSGLPPESWNDSNILAGLARLRTGVTQQQALAELNVRHHQYAISHPTLGDADLRTNMRVVLLRDQLVANVRPMLWMLFGAVGLILLITCANVASLLLARANSRSREFAVRAALGAGRGRLLRQLLAESAVLAALGGALGVLLARSSLSAIAQIDAVHLPRAGEIHLDGLVLGFTVALSIASGIFFGLFPSLQASRPNVADALRSSGESAARVSVQRQTMGVSARGLLVVGQMALSVVLLIGATLLMKSMARLHSVDSGLQPRNLVTLKIALPPARYKTGQRKLAFWTDLVRRVDGLPGVRDATVALTLPTSRRYFSAIRVAELPPVISSDLPEGQLQSITPGYFRTLRIPLRRGREFTERDDVPGAPLAVIINESLARHFWPDYPRGQDPLGQHLLFGDQEQGTGLAIVGIVADVREQGLVFDTGPEFYLPCALFPPQTGNLAVRGQVDVLSLVNAIRSQVVAIDRDQAVLDVKTMDEVLEASLGQRQVAVLLLGVFASVALLLALIGIYGVISYTVGQRTHEVGIRRALGAQQADILRLVMGQSLGLTLAGIGTGVIGALALTHVMKSLLFHVSTTDPATFISVALLFLLVALAASYVPARRATRIDPMAALRIW